VNFTTGSPLARGHKLKPRLSSNHPRSCGVLAVFRPRRVRFSRQRIGRTQISIRPQVVVYYTVGKTSAKEFGGMR
jgi:hypothetical protein